MKITDEMVRTAALEIARMEQRGSIISLGPYHLRAARVALEAVLGDVEPLEDVLGDEWVIVEAFCDTHVSANRCYVRVRERGFVGDPVTNAIDGFAWADDIDAAIRDAVANVQNGEQ